MMKPTLQIWFLLLAAGQAGAASMPAVVARQAQAYLAEHRAEAKAGDAADERYAGAFFDGFRHPDGGIWTNDALRREAYQQGQAYWRTHPEAAQRDAIFTGYGYTRVEEDGELVKGFEISSFQSSVQVGPCWLDYAGTASSKLQGAVHVAGYLSPPGQYGHLGMYHYELLAYSIVPAEKKLSDTAAQ